MTELSGTLDGVGLPAIVRFLIGLKKSGGLRLTQQDWHGEIFFVDGQVTGASLGSRSGLGALDALVETLPNASFGFDSQMRSRGEPTIRLSQAALQAHLDELAARIDKGARRLPSADALPVLIAHDDAVNGGEEPLALDRGTLQTLLFVDGQRSVRDIVARRGSFDALWQLANLVDVGLVRLETPVAVALSAADLQPIVQSQPTVEPVALPPVVSSSPVAPQPRSIDPIAVSTDLAAAHPVQVPVVRPFAPEVEPEQAARACPKLGFNDDAGHSFSRPTRLHRCFAAGTPLPLSLDQQRELCLSDQYGTCPRLSMISSPKASAGRSNGTPNRVASEPEADDPRIVRLPFAARPSAAEREAIGGGTARPTPLRARIERANGTGSAGAEASTGRHDSSNSNGAIGASGLAGPNGAMGSIGSRSTIGANGSTAGSRSAVGSFGAVTSASAVVEPPAPTVHRGPPPPPAAPQEDPAQPADEFPVDEPVERRIGKIPVGVIASAAAVLVVVATVGYLLLPGTDTLRWDDAIDPSTLPNSSLIAAGTPVSALTLPRATPAAASQTSATAVSVPATNTGQAAQPAADSATQPTANGPLAQPALVPQPTAAPVLPTIAAVPRVLFDERFLNNDAGWPSNPQGAAWITSGTYRVATREAGQFVAIGAPIADMPTDVIVSAAFRKLAGPAGGGYGIIVRDQGPGARDGASQDGRYYVLEAGDKGEIGMWRREADHWVDLLPWQHSDVVKTGGATNELTVRAIGNTLSLSINGTAVAMRTDTTFTRGNVGVFVGGDGNQVAVDHFSVQAP